MDKTDVLNKLSLDKDDIVSEGVAHFLGAQDPEEVVFVRASNGWAIKVITDEESTDTAKEFWESNVQPKLDSGA